LSSFRHNYFSMCLFLNSLMEHGNWIWHSRDAWHFFTLRFVFSTWTFKCGLKFLFRFSTDLLLARCSICNVLYRRECDCLGVSQRHVLCSFFHCNDSTCLFSSVLSVFSRNRFFLVLSLVFAMSMYLLFATWWPSLTLYPPLFEKSLL
jgi:hypothetical protein